MESKNSNKWNARMSIVCLAICLIAWSLTPIATRYFFNCLSDRGQFGDMFGSINALFSGFALVGVFYAVLLQREEVDQTKKALEHEISAHRRSVDFEKYGLYVNNAPILIARKKQGKLNYTDVSYNGTITHYDEYLEGNEIAESEIGVAQVQGALIKILLVNHGIRVFNFEIKLQDPLFRMSPEVYFTTCFENNELIELLIPSEIILAHRIALTVSYKMQTGIDLTSCHLLDTTSFKMLEFQNSYLESLSLDDNFILKNKEEASQFLHSLINV